MTDDIKLPPLPLGKRTGSGVINGKYIELRMHEDAATNAFARAAVLLDRQQEKPKS